MNIQLNGQPRDIPSGASVSQLIDILGYTGKRIAVERNGEIVPKSQHQITSLNADDKLEIVVAVGGG
jgi:sulfur carrier protein